MDISSWPPWKITLALVVSLLVLAAVMEWVGGGVPDDDAAAATGAGPEEDEVSVPIRPVLTRVDENTILIEMGVFHQSRYRFGPGDDPGEADAVYACLEEGIDREFGPADGPAPETAESPFARRRKMRQLMRKIQDRCWQGFHAPVVPPHPVQDVPLEPRPDPA